MIHDTENKERFIMTQGNRNVKVAVTFPERADDAAEQEFIGRLKEIYLRKIDCAIQNAGNEVCHE